MVSEVTILGKKYAIRSDFDQRFMDETADMVDAKMKDLQGKAGTVPTEKIAILTAMILAGELLKLRKQTESMCDTFRQKTQRLIKIVDGQL